jgi:signal transduction histidine kinase
MTTEKPTHNDGMHILLVEDDAGDAELVSALLTRSTKLTVRISREDRLSEALKRLGRDLFDLVLLDLGLPDSFGLDTFNGVHTAFPDVPIIVLTGLDDEMKAFEAVRQGAQDYLEKGGLNSVLLLKAVRYAIERQKLLVDLRNRMAEIGKLQRERVDMLSMFAHDIKNALVPAVGFLERVLSGKTNKVQDRLERTHDELLAIQRLVTNFMDFARIEAEYRPRPGSVDLDAVIRRQLDNALVKAEKKNITLHYEPDASIAVVEADGTMIERVIMNLLDNAVKYTEPGGSVVVRPLGQVNEVLVEVRDSGRGIADSHLPFVFDAFYRISRDQKGSGLGLAIAKMIIESHGGRIWVVSAPGKGSIFGFSLPRVFSGVRTTKTALDEAV